MMEEVQKVTLTEVGPRDGLQNEEGEVGTADKIKFVEALVEAGAKRIEVTSFVSPKWVPQMADASEVYRGVKKKEGVQYIALTPNPKGLQRSLEVGANAIAVFTAASETFTKKNINATIEDSLVAIGEVVSEAQKEKVWIRAYVSTCFGCPYEGDVKPQAVLEIAQKLLSLGVDELSIGDTIGVATPVQIEQVMDLLLSACPPEQIALHLHDTRGTALANTLAGLQMGIRKFDSSAGGLGGCPYAPGASGNLATEDLVYMLHGMGLDSGIDMNKLVEASQFISQALGRPLPSKYLQACLAN